jgi:hypothetical protein
MHKNLLLAGVLGVRTHQKISPVAITLLILDVYVAWYYRFLAPQGLKPGVHRFSKSVETISKF